MHNYNGITVLVFYNSHTKNLCIQTKKSLIVRSFQCMYFDGCAWPTWCCCCLLVVALAGVDAGSLWPLLSVDFLSTDFSLLSS